MGFPCTSCGLCCKNISGIAELKKYDRGDGVCKNYNELQKLCGIYEERPLFCNIEEFYKKYLNNKIMINEYYQMNATACNNLQSSNDYPEIYKVVLNDK